MYYGQDIMGVRGWSPPEGWNLFNKFAEIGNVKFKIFIHLTKISWIFCMDMDWNLRIVENSLRPGGSGAEHLEASEV